MNKGLRRRIGMSLFGVIICAISVGIFKIAVLGVDPFQSLMGGLDELIPIDFGTLYVIVNAILLVFSLIFDRHNIGIATFINLFLLGYITEFTHEMLQKIIVEPSMIIRVLCLLVGIVIICFGSAFYMTADLGVSTYDAVAIVMSKKWKLGQFKFIRIATDMVCVIAGVVLFLISGKNKDELMEIVGAGTIITAFFMGPLIDFFNRKIAIPFLNKGKAVKDEPNLPCHKENKGEGMTKVNWGVLGTADIARGCTIPGMKQAENCNLYAIAGRSMKKAVSFKEEFGFEKAYGDYDSLLADENVQAVYIPLPNHIHYEWIMKAVEAGKHVLCEKPMAPSAKEAAELFDAAKKKGVFLMEAFAYLHSPYVTALREEIDNGVIGNVSYIESAFLTSNHDMSNIRMYKEFYGGAVYDLGCYCTSMISRMIDKEPTVVQGVAEYSKEGVDLNATAIMQFGDDIRASFNCGMIFEVDINSRFDRLFIHGTKGYIKSDVEYNQSGELKYTVCSDGKTTTKTVNAPHNYKLEVEQLGRCILDGETPHVSPEFSLKNARMLDKVLEAIGY